MEKIKLEIMTPKIKKFDYNDTNIEVDTLLTVSEETFLIGNYVDTYFKSEEKDRLVSNVKYNFLGAEYNLIIFLLQIKTNVDASDISQNIHYYYPLFYEVISNITNYTEFRQRLDRVVQDMKEQLTIEMSVGNVIDKAVKEAMTLIEQFSDFSPEKLEEAKKIGIEMLEEIKNATTIPQGEKQPEEKKQRRVRKQQ